MPTWSALGMGSRSATWRLQNEKVGHGSVGANRGSFKFMDQRMRGIVSGPGPSPDDIQLMALGFVAEGHIRWEQTSSRFLGHLVGAPNEWHRDEMK